MTTTLTKDIVAQCGMEFTDDRNEESYACLTFGYVEVNGTPTVQFIEIMPTPHVMPEAELISQAYDAIRNYMHWQFGYRFVDFECRGNVTIK